MSEDGFDYMDEEYEDKERWEQDGLYEFDPATYDPLAPTEEVTHAPFEPDYTHDECGTHHHDYDDCPNNQAPASDVDWDGDNHVCTYICDGTCKPAFDVVAEVECDEKDDTLSRPCSSVDGCVVVDGKHMKGYA